MEADNTGENLPGSEAVGQELLAALVSLEQMQAEQVKGLAAGQLGSLVAWEEARERLFRKLVRCFENLPRAAADEHEKECIRHLRSRLAKAIAGETRLASEALSQKELLQARLGAMRKGKKALHNYRMQQGMASPPRYLQNRT